MVRRFFKHKLLLDENLPHRTYFPSLNERFDVKHVARDYKLGSLTDPQVYGLAREEGRLLVTYNIRHFQKLAERSNDTGVIGVSPNLSLAQIDKKLTAFLTRSGEKELLGKFIMVSGEM